MFDIISTLFESMIEFLETLVKFVGFVIENVPELFSVFNYIPTIIQAPLIMALTIVVVLGVKKAVLA